MNIDDILMERGATNGDYDVMAGVIRDIMQVLQTSPNWDKLECHEQESLHMIAHKMGRIVSGDPHLPDHWGDMAGYATLSYNRNKALAEMQAVQKDL